MTVLLIERDGPLTRLALNRPEKANALDAALVDALLGAATAAAHDGTRLLVIEGHGRNLSAGFDFSGYEQASAGDLLLRFVRIEQLLQTIYHAPYATLAFAHGHNFGAGVDLYAACAHRVAAPDTTLRMPGLRFGVQLGTRRLAQRVGHEAARSLLAESRTLCADEALQLRLVQRVGSQDDRASVVREALERAVALSSDAAARLNAATTHDTRAADMADLVVSLSTPGLIDRISHYRAKG